jgi:amino acid transporter
VSAATTQTLVAAAISLVFVFVVHRLGRKQSLSFRYTVGWLILGMVGVLAGLLLPFAEPLAEKLHVQPAALLGLGALILLLLLCVQLSISISGLQEQVRKLAEEASYLRQELDDLRNKAVND